jgi:transcriptional regulator with XRE-family HTH domain
MAKSNFSKEYKALRELLRQERIERGMTQTELSSALGMPQSFVSKYEMGERRLDFVEVDRICAELGIPLASFVGLYQEATSQTAGRKSVGSKKGGRK